MQSKPNSKRKPWSLYKTLRSLEKDKSLFWLTIGSALVCFFVIPILFTKIGQWAVVDAQTGQIGDTFGGLINPALGFLGVILTFAAFYVQFRANRDQNRQIQLQLFESKFFDLLKIHRDNVSEMILQNKKQRNVFVILRAEFQDIYEIVKNNMQNYPDPNNKIKADVSYVFLFYGLGETTSLIVQELLKLRYGNEIESKVAQITKDLEELQANIKNTKYLKEFSYGRTPYKAFNGHQVRLSHYFRHLYQTVKFVEQSKGLTPGKKKYYIKALRSQLSTHELALLFYDSISSLGKTWRKKVWPSFKNKEVKVDLITKYELIRNLPTKYFTYELEPRLFYPDITYDWDEIIKPSND